MGYVLYNEKCFCVLTETGKIAKSDLLRNAYVFESASEARRKRKQAPKKLEHFYVYEIVGDGQLNKVTKPHKRKKFSAAERLAVYNRYDGRCNLCGRKLDFGEMTIDHITPLKENGSNDMDNLAVSCQICNSIKGSILPMDFVDRVGSIYMYQTGKRVGENTLKWKLIKYLSR